MRDLRRRELPDNLDPLVDTLFNVVGILVFIVALTQLQLGDAIERLVDLESDAAVEARAASRARRQRDAEVARLKEQLATLAPTRDAILARSGGDISDGLLEIDRALSSLAEGALSPDPKKTRNQKVTEKALAAQQKKTADAKAQLAQRERHRAELARVPKELVARLPDPAIVRGEEQWILCRYQQCFLTDRKGLVEQGSRAVGRILHHNQLETIRADEFESLAHHFRKRVVGIGNFRWQIVTEKRPRARLAWQAENNGLDRTEIESGRALRAWLAQRSPDRDFIRFQVWSDSFEAYLAAREVIEAEGFRAGWRGFEANQELDLQLTFGRRPPKEGPVEVD